MSFPSISIKFIGTSCSCCSGNSDKNTYKVLYRSDKNKFIAIPAEDIKTTSAQREATLSALNAVLKEKYSVELSQVPVQISTEDLPSFAEVRTIEKIAHDRWKESNADLST